MVLIHFWLCTSACASVSCNERPQAFNDAAIVKGCKPKDFALPAALILHPPRVDSSKDCLLDITMANTAKL